MPPQVCVVSRFRIRIVPSSCLTRHSVWVFLFLLAVVSLGCSGSIYAQNQLPYMTSGPDSVFAQVDFSQIHADTVMWDQSSIDTGSVSALDMAAPENALEQFSHGARLLKAQNFKDAIRYLQKAVTIYPKFVSAHIGLGLAYLDQQDRRAKQEFETAASLDDRFACPFINLGVLALAANDFPVAEANLEKAASLSPGDPKILTALAFAENGAHKYREALQTVQRVHLRQHQGMANIHYIGASAAIALQQFDTARRELSSFLSEDPANPLAPIARQKLDDLETHNGPSPNPAHALNIQLETDVPSSHVVTFPNSEKLKAQLRTVADEPESDACDNCSPAIEVVYDIPGNAWPSPDENAPTFATWNNVFTIHQTVDETALFFAVSQHGHMINDLSLSDIQVRDDNKPPDRVVQFIPQSRLPLRLALLVDASDSVRNRAQFEKDAAKRFLHKVLTGGSDLAFVAGFSNEVEVTQDFTRNVALLDSGIQKLRSGGNGTSVFDAVFYACWKLAAYPDEGRVAKVLVILTDGEDNSSRRSLKQAIDEAESAGVTIYTLSTSELPEAHTDAIKILKVLAERSGGESIVPGDLPALDHYLNALPNVIRSRYLIAYKAADFQADGKYRSVQVRAEKGGQRLKVHVRKGYYTRLSETSEATISSQRINFGAVGSVH